MNKNMLIASGCSLLLSLSPLANAAQGPYVAGNLGYAMGTDIDLTDQTFSDLTATMETKGGLALGIAGGYDFGSDRLELEFGYQKNDVDTFSMFGYEVDAEGDTSGMGLLLNGYHDFRNASAFTPFIGAGIGFAKIELNDFNLVGSGEPSESFDDTVFAYQVGAGVSYAVNQQVDLEVKYRYFATQDPEFDGVDAEISSHQFFAGVRVAF